MRYWRNRYRLRRRQGASKIAAWMLLAGRGFGKTRTGVEWVRAEVAAGRKRIALVAPTAAVFWPPDDIPYLSRRMCLSKDPT
jgi:phage terminase large subunit-like protein